MKPFEPREVFYNFKDLCYAVLRKDMQTAMSVFTAQSKGLFCIQDQKEKVCAMRVFLTSMNRGIYNYILFALDISLHDCCSENGIIAHGCQTQEQFYKTAEQMISSYCRQFECASACNPHIAKAKEYIEQNLDAELSLKQVAVSIHVNPSYLSELFTCCTGKRFSVYVRERRLERAAGLLLSSRKTIQDISQICGFSSSAYFSTVFTKWAGVSPRQYRTRGRIA